MPDPIELRVNGAARTLQTDPDRTLLSVLRDDLELTGAKYGCGEGQCGACTVLVDGRPVRSCLTAVRAVAGKEILTVEGLEKEGRLHPVQEAFLELGAMQCGFCTCGMILSAVALLNSKPKPTEQDVVQAMNGNLCRCCAYPRIAAAVQRAASKGGR
ncbi:MAG: (2Fe-2S)-binding protein [Planctomycetes bacterium]|nr:(2Fe-2S)-binding protein [Planctomycetota bacterium]